LPKANIGEITMSKTVRDEALNAIKAGQSVVINGEQYTMDNIDELPPLEDFAAGDPEQEASAMTALRKEKEELERRLTALQSKVDSTTQVSDDKEDAGKKSSSSKSTKDDSEGK